MTLLKPFGEIQDAVDLVSTFQIEKADELFFVCEKVSYPSKETSFLVFYK